MYLIVGLLCAKGFACLWYPVDSAKHLGERACMKAVPALHDGVTGFAPYVTLKCKYAGPQRRME